MTDLPEGWEETSIKDLFAFKYGKGLTQEKRKASGGKPVYGSNGIVGEHDQAITKGPAIIVGRKGSVGEVHFSPVRCWPIDTTYFIDEFPDGSPPEYWALYLRSLGLGQQEKSSAIPGISRQDIYKLKVAVPPVDEQRRIVAKLEELLGKVEACQNRLANIPVILKRFRQSVLAAACSGRLTADWRDANSHCESAFELLSRMSEKHQAEVEALAQHECPDDEIPSTWTWVRFGDLIRELRNGVSIRPNMEPPGTAILRISAARPGRVDLDDIRYLSQGEQFFPQYKLADRDLLFTRYNGSLELLGVCGMVRDLGSRELLYPDKLMRVRFDYAFVMPEYTEIFFQAAAVHERVIAKAKSSAGQNGVSGADIKSQPFALPPLVEQEQIVRRVETLFKLADQIEARYRKAQAQVDKLTQSILAKAFRGELVPTEAELARREGRDYEPASVLLERIRTGRSNEGVVKPTTKANRFQARRLSKGVVRKK